MEAVQNTHTHTVFSTGPSNVFTTEYILLRERVLVEQGICHFQQLKHACAFDVDIDIENNITFSMLDHAPLARLEVLLNTLSLYAPLAVEGGVPPRRTFKTTALRNLCVAHELTVTTQTRFRSAP